MPKNHNKKHIRILKIGEFKVQMSKVKKTIRTTSTKSLFGGYERNQKIVNFFIKDIVNLVIKAPKLVDTIFQQCNIHKQPEPLRQMGG